MHAVDRVLVTTSVRRRRERPGLLAFVFHNLFESHAEIEPQLIAPYQALLVPDLRRFIAYFLEHGYRFVTPRQILSGLDPLSHHALLTVDDGYATNLRALAVLREFSVPATFFISATHVRDGKAFWWDVIRRERHRRGVAEESILREEVQLKRRPYDLIEAHLRSEFGAPALLPVGEWDRPMTPAELKAFASEPLVTLGNHTADHAVLPMHTDSEVTAQIRLCQDYLAEVTDTAPEIIAYPNGNYDSRVVRLARAEGLRLGVTVAPRKNRLPLTANSYMTIARYDVPGGPNLLDECARARRDFQPLNLLRRFRQRSHPAY